MVSSLGMALSFAVGQFQLFYESMHLRMHINFIDMDSAIFKRREILDGSFGEWTIPVVHDIDRAAVEDAGERTSPVSMKGSKNKKRGHITVTSYESSQGHTNHLICTSSRLSPSAIQPPTGDFHK